MKVLECQNNLSSIEPCVLLTMRKTHGYFISKRKGQVKAHNKVILLPESSNPSQM